MVKFEWDQTKEKNNIEKHGIPFSEALFVFSDKFGLTLYDKNHSIDEDRWITLGRLPDQRICLVVHTYRQVNAMEIIRIISARKATRKEEKQYIKRVERS